MAFWQTELATESTISVILDKEDVKLEEVLDEPTLLQELKADNAKLLEYLRSRVLEMVKLALGDPGGDWKDQGRYKYAHLSAEVLSANVEALSVAMFQDEGVRAELGAFLRTAQANSLNPLTASFYCKLITQMLAKQPPSDGEVARLVRSMDGLTGDLLKHLGTSAVMDVLFRLVTVPEEEEEAYAIKEYLVQQGLVDGLLAALDSSRTPEEQLHASVVWCELIRVLRDLQYNKDEKSFDPLLEALQGEAALKGLLDRMLSPEGRKCNSVLELGATVFINLLQTIYIQGNPMELAQKAAESFHEDSETTSEEEEAVPEDASHQAIWTPDPGHVVEATLAARLQDINDVLKDAAPLRDLDLTMGKTGSLGSGRLTLVKLLGHLLNTNHPLVQSETRRVQLLRSLFALIRRFPWNNFLHSAVGQAVSCVLFSGHRQSSSVGIGSVETTPPFVPLIHSLFHECGLLEFILDSTEPSESKKFPCGLPYKAHVMNMARMVQCARHKGPNVPHLHTAIGSLPAEMQSRWEAFVSGPLKVYIQANSPDSVEDSRGTLGTTMVMEPDDTESEAQAAVADFRKAGPMGSALPANFGLPMDDMTIESFGDKANKAADVHVSVPAFPDLPSGEAAFESLCSERASLGPPLGPEKLDFPDDPFAASPGAQVSEGWADFSNVSGNQKTSSDSDSDGGEGAAAMEEDPWSAAASTDAASWKADFSVFGAESEASAGFAVATSEANSPPKDPNSK